MTAAYQPATYGYNNTCSGYNTSVFGNNNTVAGNYGTACGYNNSISDTWTIVVGQKNNASNEGACAIGYQNTASGQYSLAIGYKNTASGQYSIAIGNTYSIYGSYSIPTVASGNVSVAIGNNCTAASLYSVTIGNWNTTFGAYNNPSPSGGEFSAPGAVAVGFGNNMFLGGATYSFYRGWMGGEGPPTIVPIVGAQSTAVGVFNTAASYYGVSVGAFNLAGPFDDPPTYGSLAFGLRNWSSNNTSTACGYNNTVSGEGASAFGYRNTASGNSSTACGYANSVSGQNSSAFGYGNTNSGNYSVVIGNDVSNSTNNIVVIGSPTLIGTATAPTVSSGDNSTNIATTAFVQSALTTLASPTFTGTPIAPTATFGTDTTQLATTAFVQNAFGTIMSLPLPVYAASFNGSNYVLIGSSIASTIGSGDFSIFAWVKTSNIGADNGIVYIGNSTSEQGVALMTGLAGTINCLVTGVGWTAQGITTITDGNWHFVGVVSSSGFAQIYVDGSTDGSSASITISLSGSTYLGVAPAYGGLVGDMSETLIFNRALSGGEITSLYNSGIGKYGNVSNAPWNSDLVAGYHLNNDFTDYSGNENDGANEGAVTFVTGFIPVPTYVESSWSTVFLNTSSVLAPVNLETAIGNAGHVHTIKDSSGNASTNNIIVASYGSQSIDGGSSIVISTAYGYVKLQSDGSNWFVIG